MIRTPYGLIGDAPECLTDEEIDWIVLSEHLEEVKNESQFDPTTFWWEDIGA